jgi:hypothetical protein
LTLHNTISKCIPSKELPQFPPKLMSGNFQKEKIEKRKIGLQKYLNGVIKIKKLDVSFILKSSF